MPDSGWAIVRADDVDDAYAGPTSPASSAD